MFKFLYNNLLWSQDPIISTVLIICIVLSILLKFKITPVLILILLFLLFFFRNPQRVPLDTSENVLIAPADGKIIKIEELQGSQYYKKISIFLSPIDVHVNWIPISGIIKEVKYKKGEFHAAFLDKSSELNEQNSIIIKSNFGDILVKQISGALARRIVCWIKKDEPVLKAQKYGMIKFGSRVDLFLPNGFITELKVGDKVLGGHSIIGRF